MIAINHADMATVEFCISTIQNNFSRLGKHRMYISTCYSDPIIEIKFLVVIRRCRR